MKIYAFVMFFMVFCASTTASAFDYVHRYDAKPIIAAHHPTPKLKNGSSTSLRARISIQKYFAHALTREACSLSQMHEVVPSYSVIVRTLYICDVLEFIPEYETFELEHTFSKISYEQGIRHIHSLEHLERVHKIGNPGFKVLTATKPSSVPDKHVLGYVHAFLTSCPAFFSRKEEAATSCLAFFSRKAEAATYRGNHLVECRQFSRLRNESNILCLNPETLVPEAYFRFCVMPLSSSDSGHLLRIRLTLHKNSPLIGGGLLFNQQAAKQRLLEIIKMIYVLEDKCFWSYDFASKHEAHEENLARYRRMILFNVF